MSERRSRQNGVGSGLDITASLIPGIEDVSARPQAKQQSKRPEHIHPGSKADGARTIDGQINDGGDEDDDDEAFIAAQQTASNRKSSSAKGATPKKGGGFQSMGFNPTLLKAVTRKGFAVPTPIQRKTIPLILDGQDVVGMARTGSGKTAAFVIPMIEKLKAHSAQVGSRAILISPSRELAIQTIKTVKELSKGTDLRAILLVGGDSLEDDFNQMTSNPDIIIATPGRFMHLMVEMSLDLSSVRYVVFDEADRLFEMGFATQLNSICLALPPSRQTMLFSATLPSSLVEFAKAGLKEPELVRLDADSKISPTLESAFLTIKSADKDGALLHLLSDVIQVPMGNDETTSERPRDAKKRKRGTESETSSSDLSSSRSTIVFASTKHHVEYLTSLLRTVGYGVSFVYGTLDQTARKNQVDKFRSGRTNVLVVTDVAARGIDIPLLANVINYEFPPQPKVFVHRVGRTGRAGRKGWSYSICEDSRLPYLIDLQLFLGRTLVQGRNQGKPASFAEDVVLGSIPQLKMQKHTELAAKLVAESDDLNNLQLVANRGEKQYFRSRKSASPQSVKRAKVLIRQGYIFQESNLLYEDDKQETNSSLGAMLSKISSFRPNETVFELAAKRINGDVPEIVSVIQKQRKSKPVVADVAPQERVDQDGALDLNRAAVESEQDFNKITSADGFSNDIDLSDDDLEGSDNLEDDEELEVSFPQRNTDSQSRSAKEAWKDTTDFMSYEPRTSNLVDDHAYGVNSGADGRSSNFADAARNYTMDMNNDETSKFAEPSKPRQQTMRWDKKSKKYVNSANDIDGSKGRKFITGEHGQKMAASFRSGRFDAWKKANRMHRMPRVGERETPQQANASSGPAGRRFKHYAARAPKAPDQYRDDYYKKKKRADELKQSSASGSSSTQYGAKKPKSELKGVQDLQKQRQLKQKRKEKNARPSRKPKS